MSDDQQTNLGLPGTPQEATKKFRAEILTIFFSLFWSKRWPKKDILKLSDLQQCHCSGRPNRPQLLLPRAGRSMWANCVFHKFCTNLLDRPTKELYRRISADYLCTACPNDNNLGTIELITRSANNCRHAIISRGLYIFNTLNGGQFCSLKGDFS